MSFASLGAEFPRLAARLAHMPDGAVDEGARRVVEGALERNGVSVADRGPAAVERLVWALDDAVWKLQEDVEKGTATQAAYNQAFRRARAANGLLDLLQANYARAIYEATQALYANEDIALELLGDSSTSGEG